MIDYLLELPMVDNLIAISFFALPLYLIIAFISFEFKRKWLDKLLIIFSLLEFFSMLTFTSFAYQILLLLFFNNGIGTGNTLSDVPWIVTVLIIFTLIELLIEYVALRKVFDR